MGRMIEENENVSRCQSLFHNDVILSEVLSANLKSQKRDLWQLFLQLSPLSESTYSNERNLDKTRIYPNLRQSWAFLTRFQTNKFKLETRTLASAFFGGNSTTLKRAFYWTSHYFRMVIDWMIRVESSFFFLYILLHCGFWSWLPLSITSMSPIKEPCSPSFIPSI